MMAERLPAGSVRITHGESEQTYVPLATYQEALDQAQLRGRTLALVHMHLVLGQDVEAAVARIQRDMGYTLESARAVAEVVAWATQPRDTMSQ